MIDGFAAEFFELAPFLFALQAAFDRAFGGFGWAAFFDGFQGLGDQFGQPF